MAATLNLQSAKYGPINPIWSNPNLWNNVGGTCPGDQSTNANIKANSLNLANAWVQNDGDAAANNVTLSFYYCTPGGPAGDWSNFLSNYIGQVSLGTIAPGQGIQACMQWTAPNYPGMHSCMLAYVTASNDPGPAQSGSINLADRHLAQHNYNIQQLAKGTTECSDTFTSPVVNDDSTITVRITQVPLSEALQTPANQRRMQNVSEINASLDYQLCTAPDAASRIAPRGLGKETAVNSEDFGSTFGIKINLPADLESGTGAAFFIESLRDGQVMSGFTKIIQIV